MVHGISQAGDCISSSRSSWNLMPGRLPTGLDWRGVHGLSLPFMTTPPNGCSPCVQGDAVGDAVEPTRQATFVGKLGGMPRQDNEGGLKCVFCIMKVAKETTAHRVDQWAMSA